MQQITLSIHDDYIVNFMSLLDTLPVDKIHITDEDKKFGSLLQKSHKNDYVSKSEVFEALSSES